MLPSMSNHKNISLWAIKGAAAFLVLLLIFLLLLTKLINLELIRERIFADLSGKIGCELRFQRAEAAQPAERSASVYGRKAPEFRPVRIECPQAQTSRCQPACRTRPPPVYAPICARGAWHTIRS